MAIIKCKMCGGDMVLNDERTFGTCQYCGCSMTLPKVADDRRAALFNRGNHFRRLGEFDQALAVYESIVREDDSDAEAHWCCALCRFGIEYVEDPNTFEYIPTCHRASFDSILQDVDYLAALEYSDGLTKKQYQKDAAKIAEVQRGILAASMNEKPFDVFICYKETDDETKQRTRDSIDAQDIYYQLTNEGYRVFFSRITLEDKAGTEYEPYIFSALNSAKVMVVIGSKPEYFNAVWVKNEWSRFLMLLRKDRSRLILPCYKNMDPYELPEQLSVLQSYDMTKIGFIQDLVRGIRKVIPKDDPASAQPAQSTAAPAQPAQSLDSLVRRGNISLAEGDFENAISHFNKALDIAPSNGDAYLGILLATTRQRTQESFANQFIHGNIAKSNIYERAKQYASPRTLTWFKNMEEDREAEKARSVPERPYTPPTQSYTAPSTAQQSQHVAVAPQASFPSTGVPTRPWLIIPLAFVGFFTYGAVAITQELIEKGNKTYLLTGALALLCAYGVFRVIYNFIASFTRKIGLRRNGSSVICSWDPGSKPYTWYIGVNGKWAGANVKSPVDLGNIDRGSTVTVCRAKVGTTNVKYFAKRKVD